MRANGSKTFTSMSPYTATIPPKLPLLGIDLGYSATQASCGIATINGISESLEFGDCIEWTANYLNTNGPHVLILEAVLSTYHNPEGNPANRGDFEKGRGWYHGPGVSTFAAALRFLNQLEIHYQGNQTIPLVEGFLSYKPKKTTHADDAKRLVKEFHTAEQFVPLPGSQAILPSIVGVPEIRRYNAP